jgi:tyrosyl-tRNA synthetase
MPLLEGLDGVHKMSKSLGNYVGLWEPADEAYGKLMSVSDELMWRYYALLVEKTDAEIAAMQQGVANQQLHPMKLKKEMAFAIVKRYWSEAEAAAAQQQFEALFQRQDYSAAQEVAVPASVANPVWIVELLKALGALQTSSEAKRLIESKAVEVDGVKVDDFKTEIAWKAGMIIKVGKHRIYKIKG